MPVLESYQWVHYHHDNETYPMVAFFPDYQLDNGHMLETNPTFGSAIFSSNYPPYPDAQKLHQNPTLPVVDKEYSTDDNSSTTDKSVDFSSEGDKEEEEEENSDCEQSYM